MRDDTCFGFDGRCVTALEGRRLSQELSEKRISVRADRDLSEGIWTERPAFPCSKVFVPDEEKYAGRTVAQKLADLRRELAFAGASFFVSSKLDEIMWLFNVRGDDVECNPVAMSNCLISGNDAFLFLQEEAVTEEVRAHLAKYGVKLMNYGSFQAFLRDFDFDGAVAYDPKELSFSLAETLRSAQCREIASPLEKMKAVKNAVEAANARSCYLEDSAMLTKFIYWLKRSAGKIPMTEYTAAMKLDGMRAQISDFMGLSFGTISAYGPNAAMMHYSADEESAAEVLPEGMLLVDSGGQYLRGTTDVTRTMSLGPVTDEMRRAYTLTAVGCLSLQNAVFLHGCTGRNLDILAREPLWRVGIDYKCGTGHGIGNFLNVHEGPQNIRWKHAADEAMMEAGMIVSDEPGVYRENEFGIRIETILLTVERETTPDGTFLAFEPLTFVPLDRELLDPQYLTQEAREQLNRYHAEVYSKLSPMLDEEERAWLEQQTMPL
ncbi:MAG: aminopeptidase P family protein, partial [Lachnospiraceae bacterium]|nr:aminopeptidase P family protein [Lachnospiraceae bacterium]